MNQHSWWYLSRASGLIAWIVIAATCMWGILLITRMLKPADRPAWLLDLHRYLGVLSIVTTLAHMVALVGDNWMYFGWKELFVPGAFSNSYQPELHAAVIWGSLAFYLMVLIQVSSWLMRFIPKRAWHGIHLSSYVMFVMVTVHGLQAGTDVDNMVLLMTMAGVVGIILFALVARILQGRAKRIQRATTKTLTRA